MKQLDLLQVDCVSATLQRAKASDVSSRNRKRALRKSIKQPILALAKRRSCRTNGPDVARKLRDKLGERACEAHGCFEQRLLATLETRRKMDRVNFCKDFWNCYLGLEKKCPIADRRVPCNHPRNNCGTHPAPLPISFLKCFICVTRNP